MSLGSQFLFCKMEIEKYYLVHILFLDLGDSYVGVFKHSLCDNSLSCVSLFGPLIYVCKTKKFKTFKKEALKNYQDYKVVLKDQVR